MDDSVTALRRAAALAGDSPILSAVLARAEALAGRAGQAREILAALDAGSAGTPSDYQRAAAEVALGDHDEAFRRLEAAAAAREPWMVWLRVDPMLRDLRKDARYRSLLLRVFGSLS